MIDREPKTVQDLIDKLLALTDEQRKATICTYHMGNRPDVTHIEVDASWGKSEFVEINLCFYEY